MKRAILLLVLCIWISVSSASDTVVNLTRQDLAKITPGQSISREAFDSDWGQFEVRIPKKRFPVPAPNCRKNVILRMPAVPEKAEERDKQLEYRWRQFQSLHELSAGKVDHLEVRIASRPYMKTDQHGRSTLKYCNAYIAPHP
jgi:hypothetical protein